MPVSGVLTSCATPAASTPIDAIFSDSCSCSTSRTRSVMFSISRIVPATIAASSSRALERHRRHVDQQPRRVFVAPGERHAEQRRSAGILAALGAQRFDERRLEHVGERAVDGVGPRHAVERFERAVPADNPLAPVEHDQPVVERFEDVLVELAQAVELFRLQVQLAIQAAVLDRGRRLSGDGGQQREVLAVERLVGVLPAERQHGNRAALEHARDEVVDAGVAPELDLLGHEARGRDRIVERHGVAGVQPCDATTSRATAAAPRAKIRNR